MWKFPVWIAAFLLLSACGKESRMRRTLETRTGDVTLEDGEIKLSAPIELDNVQDFRLSGNRTKLKMNFDGPAAIVIRNSRNVTIAELTIEGNRQGADRRFDLPPANQPMARWNTNNGILVENSEGVTLQKLTIREVVSYPVLVSASKRVNIREVFAGDSGSLTEKGKNNATGGILLEEGCEDFTVEACKVRNVRGNGIWTHSLYKSKRNRLGAILGNDIRHVGRDALQVGHAQSIRVEGNTGGFVGFPPEVVDLESGAVPVAVDTAGNVDTSRYAENRFEEVNGKCIDLDGFHDGDVASNECLNKREAGAYPHGHFGIVLNNTNPDMESKGIRIVSNVMEGFRYGGLFLIGTGHTVKDNTFRKVNLMKCDEKKVAGCIYWHDEPDLLRSGIYLGRKAERPAAAKGNVIENNTVQGYGMATRCIGAAPGVSPAANTIRNNKCSEQ